MFLHLPELMGMELHSWLHTHSLTLMDSGPVLDAAATLNQCQIMSDASWLKPWLIWSRHLRLATDRSSVFPSALCWVTAGWSA